MCVCLYKDIYYIILFILYIWYDIIKTIHPVGYHLDPLMKTCSLATKSIKLHMYDMYVICII